jgi:ABC-type oligopeptide transport system ATPase subunit
MTATHDDVILDVKNLSTYIFTRTSVVKAVDGVSFDLRQGETLGVVGESGCGKTTTSKLILRLENPTEGQILLEGRDIQSFKGPELQDYRTMVQAVSRTPGRL